MILISFLFFSGFIQPVRADEPLTFELADSVQVDGSGVYLKQIVKSGELLPALRLCDAPDIGKTIDLTRDQVSNLVAAASTNLVATNWTGADTIEVSRRMHTLTEAATLELLTATLQKNFVKDRGELELSFTQPWTEPTLPDEPLTVKILELPYAGVTRAFIIRFELCTTNQTVGTWETSMQAHIWRDVWVAHSNLQRDDLVSGADVVQEQRDVLGVNEPLAQFSPADTSLQFADAVESGNILLARNLKARTVIHRGQMADALLQDGALSIMMKVEVLEDGSPGQIVRVRNPVSLHSLTGKVVDDQTIAISL